MSFDTLAPCYRAMEIVMAGGLLQRSRTAHLGEVQNCQRALLLGEGPGLFLEELLRTNPRVQVVCVERSGPMIAAAKQALHRGGFDAGRVVFQQCDILEWPAPTAEFDLVVTHFFLDCFRPEDLERIAAKVAHAALANAIWLVTDFCVPPSGWQRVRAKILLCWMYAFFRRATRLSAAQLTPPGPFLEANGFRLAQRQVANFGFVRADIWRRAGG